MRITKETKYFAVEPILRRQTEEWHKEQEVKAVRAVLGDDGYLGLTLGQLSQAIDGKNMGAIVQETDPMKIGVFEWYVLRGFQAFIDDFLQKLEKLTPQQNSAEKRAANACMKQTITEGLLFFVRDYFGLHSFREAERVTLAEILLAKKDTYNKVTFQRVYNEIMSKKK